MLVNVFWRNIDTSMSRTFTKEQADEIMDDFSDLEGTGIFVEMDEISVGGTVARLKEIPLAGDAYRVVIVLETGHELPIEDYITAYNVRYNYPQ